GRAHERLSRAAEPSLARPAVREEDREQRRRAIEEQLKLAWRASIETGIEEGGTDLLETQGGAEVRRRASRVGRVRCQPRLRGAVAISVVRDDVPAGPH